MKIIAVDDEPKALNSFLRVLQEVEPQAEISSFTDPEEAFLYLAQNTVDVAFLDIKMDGLTGIELAEKCKILCPTINIIFVTGYSQYAKDALRHPLPQKHKRVRIQTFGNFEVFVDDRALHVARTKCKECLAYLVDRRGVGVPYAQLSSVLWEDQPIDRSVQKKTQKVISDLVKALGGVDAQNILTRTRIDIAVNPTMVDCDYYQAIAGDMAWMNSFTGEYMSNYSWAEFTLGELVEIKKRNIML